MMNYPIMDLVLGGENPNSIFEVGSAAGQLMKSFSENKPSLRVGGIEINEGNLKQAKINYPKQSENFILFDASEKHWPIQSNSYDIVISVGTLILLQEVYTPLKEMMRIAKHKVIIAEHHNGSLEGVEKIENYNWWNYEKVFKELYFNYEICGTLKEKTVFKCKKT